MQQSMSRQASTRQPQDTLIYANNRNTVGPSVYPAGRTWKDVHPSTFHNALTGAGRRPLNGGLLSILPLVLLVPYTACMAAWLKEKGTCSLYLAW